MTTLQGATTESGYDQGGDSLAWLLHPTSVDEFAAEYFQERPLIVARHQPDYYSALMTFAELDRQLPLTGPALEHVEVAEDGEVVRVADLAVPGSLGSIRALFDRYRDGATIIIQHMEQRHLPLQQMVQRLGAEMSLPLHVNVYLSPATQREAARPPHYDPHDLFIAQIHGSKRWRLAPQAHRLPLEDQPYDRSQQVPAPDHDVVLNPGDLLYMPRGTVHWAEVTGGGPSVHMTIGLHPQLYGEVLADGLAALAHRDLRFRRGLPLGFTRDAAVRSQAAQVLAELAKALVDELPADALVDQAARRAATQGLPPREHHLLDLEQVNLVCLSTPVRQRPGQLHYLTEKGSGNITLHFNGTALEFAAAAGPAVKRIAAASDGSWLTASELPGLMTTEQLELVRALVRTGFLTLHG